VAVVDESEPLSEVTGPGTVAGVEVTEVDQFPWPALFTAETLKSYAVPLVKPVTIVFVVELVPSTKGIQVPPNKY
jgi:hypothetical protein